MAGIEEEVPSESGRAVSMEIVELGFCNRMKNFCIEMQAQ
jgi:hypothetical protein